MKILQLIDSFNSGGAERMCINITNVLYDNGYDVQICATRQEGTLIKCIAQGVKSHTLNKRNSLDFIAFTKLIRLLRAEKINVIHAHSSSLFWAVAAKFFLNSLKVIWHDHLGARTQDQIKNLFYRILSYKVDAIIAVNEELARWSRRHMLVPSEKIVVNYNFPLLRSVQGQPDPGLFIIVCLANLRSQKDHGTLVRAIDILQRMKLPIRFKVIFAGSFMDDRYYYGLISLINELHLGEIIEIKGPVEDTALLLSTANCGVLSSISEGLPLSLLEYGMAGLPVIVTETGHCAEVVGYGKFGKVVPSKNPQLLAEALEDYILRREELEALGAVFKEHIIKNYGPKRFISEFIPLINTL